MKDFICVILAAGEGTRMKSETPKVLHNICGRPMIEYVFDILSSSHFKKQFLVVSKKQQQLLDYLKKNKIVRLIFQKKPQGTADAVKSARAIISRSKGNVLVCCADVPLIREETIESLIDRHNDNSSSCTILTTFLSNPFGFGRILRDQFSKVCAIIEEEDANPAQKQIQEINSGIYCFKSRDLLEVLSKVGINPKKKEYYLTDVVKIMHELGKKIDTCICHDSNEILGINSRTDLSKANNIMRRRIINNLSENSVAVIDPETTFINYGVSIGKETTIYPFTFIESGVKIGSECSIGPFCHLREGTVIKDKNVVGNFTEIVRSSLGEGVFFKHFGYLGDTTVGDRVNIGAGTVVANYDGKDKNPTSIKDNAFIGCDTVIVAPAKIGKGAITGAGSVITKGSNIKDKSVVVGIPAKPLVKSSEAHQKKHKTKKK